MTKIQLCLLFRMFEWVSAHVAPINMYSSNNSLESQQPLSLLRTLRVPLFRFNIFFMRWGGVTRHCSLTLQERNLPPDKVSETSKASRTQPTLDHEHTLRVVVSSSSMGHTRPSSKTPAPLARSSARRKRFSSIRRALFCDALSVFCNIEKLHARSRLFAA